MRFLGYVLAIILSVEKELQFQWLFPCSKVVQNGNKYHNIVEVRERAYLYDVMAEAYNNPTWRISAWNEVGMSLECSAEQVGCFQ